MFGRGLKAFLGLRHKRVVLFLDGIPVEHTLVSWRVEAMSTCWFWVSIMRGMGDSWTGQLEPWDWTWRIINTRVRVMRVFS